MTLTEQLGLFLASGVRHIGEVQIEASDSNEQFKLFRHSDAGLISRPDFGGLEVFYGPSEARQISLYGEDGAYRFLKAQRNLRRGWLMVIESLADLRLALDQFYPAALGLWVASREGVLEVEDLRHKLSRQTGMYRRAQLLTDGGAQALVPATCGADPACSRRILWGISPTLTLDPSPASQGAGMLEGISESAAIPLLCAAPCSHFIAECREAAKREATPPPA